MIAAEELGGELRAIEAKVLERLAGADWLLICGSLPPTVPPGFYSGLLAMARETGRTDDARVRQELALAWSREQIMRYLQMRSQTAVMTGRRELAVHGSLLKNSFTRALAHRVTLALDLQGPAGTLDRSDARGDGFWQYQCLNQFASRIGGGTEEVHRNNLAEQALGLPREPRTDLDRPWNESVRA